MAKMRILGRANSGNVQRAMWCAEELGLAVERIDVGGAFGGNDTPEYRAKNPNGLVPVLEDGDFVLWESNAIIQYLCSAYGGEPWYPADPKRRGIAAQWMFWSETEILRPQGPLFFQLIRVPPEKQDKASFPGWIAESARRWAIVDGVLAGRPYIAGDRPTMGDLALGPLLHRWLHLPIERPEHRNVQAWYRRLAERPAFARHVAVPLT